MTASGPSDSFGGSAAVTAKGDGSVIQNDFEARVRLAEGDHGITPDFSPENLGTVRAVAVLVIAAFGVACAIGGFLVGLGISL